MVLAKVNDVELEGEVLADNLGEAIRLHSEEDAS